tara:strand:- start:15345 stop:17546 length:2202 start_codon:yes stop_codon:yes gene_type:complete
MMLPEQSKYSFYLHALVLGSSLIAVNIIHSFFSQMSANQNGTFPFHESAAVLMAETAKACLAVVLLLKAFIKQKQNTQLQANISNIDYFKPSLRLVLDMSIPAALYTVSNILSYTAIGLLGSTGYQLFGNARIIVTAITFRTIVQKPLTVIQWMSLILLSLALLIATHSNHDFVHSAKKEIEDRNRLLMGIAMVLILSFTSSFAGVFSEVKLKRINKHPMLQNSILYAWCCLFSLLQYYWQTIRQFSDIRPHTNVHANNFAFFQGFSAMLWGAIVTSAVYGQIVALIFYYCDNMVKVFANSSTVIVSLVIDHIYFGKDLSIEVCVSGCIVFICTILYYIDNSILLQDDTLIVKRYIQEQHIPSVRGLCCATCFLLLVVVVITAQGMMHGIPKDGTGSNVELLPMDHKSKSIPLAENNNSYPIRRQSSSPVNTEHQKNVHNTESTQNSFEYCDWPLPIYPQYTTTKPSQTLLKNMENLKSFFQENSKYSFSYIDSGQALGMYRNGGFISSDGDIDVRYGICLDCLPNTKTTKKFPRKIGAISMNNFAEWGDMWTRKAVAFDVDAEYLKSVKSDLCLQNYSDGHSYWVHKNNLQRSAFQFTYGDFWFVRLPWKGVHQVTRWETFAQTIDRTIDMWHDSWRRSLSKIQTMDANKDNIINISELNQYLLRDGIIYERYEKSISEYERCRAAAMLTFLVRFQKNPVPLNVHAKFGSNGRLELFRFAECRHPISLESTY